ncbi:3719_t:CDS:1, partial [Gigaspora rosea]
NFSESTNLGYPSFDLPLFSDPSVLLSPLNFECSTITNVEPEIYPTFESTDFPLLSPLYSECSAITNVEPEVYPTFESYPNFDSIDYIPISPLYAECFTINNAETELYQTFEFIDFLPLYVEHSAIEPEKYLIFDQLNFDELV